MDGQHSGDILKPGVVLDRRYRILRPLGAGGMGSIYIAEHMRFGREVAIKVLSAQGQHDRKARERFTLEAKAVCHLQHPHLVTYHDFGTDPNSGCPYLVLELLKGRDLAGVMRRDAPLPLSRVVHILGQLCDALSEAHAHGVIHRDLKPANVMLVRRGDDPDFVKLIDFGIVRVVQEEMPSDDLTGAGMIIGTTGYLAPEYIQFQQVDFRVDLYALGIIGYELIAGHRPFVHSQASQVLRMHVTAPVPPLSTLEDGRRVPELLNQTISRALAKRPEDRFPSVRAFKEHLLAASRPLLASAHADRTLRRSASDSAAGDHLPTRRQAVPETPRGAQDATTPERAPARGEPPATTTGPSELSPADDGPTPSPPANVSTRKTTVLSMLLGATLAIAGVMGWRATAADSAAPETSVPATGTADAAGGSPPLSSPAQQEAVTPRRAEEGGARVRDTWSTAPRTRHTAAQPRARRPPEHTAVAVLTEPPPSSPLDTRRAIGARAKTRTDRANPGARGAARDIHRPQAPPPKPPRYEVEVVARPFGMIRHNGRAVGQDQVVLRLPKGRHCFRAGENPKPKCRTITKSTRLAVSARAE